MEQIIIRRATIADAVKLSAISIQTFYDTFVGTCKEEDMTAFLKEYFKSIFVGKDILRVKGYCWKRQDESPIVGKDAMKSLF